jgi:hypothetical protein
MDKKPPTNCRSPAKSNFTCKLKGLEKMTFLWKEEHGNIKGSPKEPFIFSNKMTTFMIVLFEISGFNF